MRRALLVLAAGAAVAAAAQLPNIVVFVADDLGVGDVGAYGAVSGRTDTWDRLATLGLKATNFDVTQSVCSASRASMMTGRLPAEVGVYTNQSWPTDEFYRVFLPPNPGCMPTSVPTVAELLRTAGYYTAMIGKWHLGSNVAANCTPAQRGFEDYFGLLFSHEEGFPGSGPEDLVFPPIPLHYKTSIFEQPVDFTSLTQRYTARALNIIARASQNASRAIPFPNPGPLPPLTPPPYPGQPLFLWVAYEEPHVPLIANATFFNTSRRGPYGDSVRQMDWSMANIMWQLESVGMLSNTVVFATSDNGAWLEPSDGYPGDPGDPTIGGSNGPRRDGKGSTWEGGFNVPFVAYGRGIPAGQILHSPISALDLLPTIAGLANLPPPAGARGVDIWGWLNGSWSQEGGAGNPASSFSTLAALPVSGQRGPDPHPDGLPYWQDNVLFAYRLGAYKAHFWTETGFSNQAPVFHDPPLLFNLDYDFGESFPLNTSLPPFDTILAQVVAAAQAHNQSVLDNLFPSQFEALDWSVVPCCNQTYNATQAEEWWQEGRWDLSIWDVCVCNDEPNAINRITWGNVTWWS